MSDTFMPNTDELRTMLAQQEKIRSISDSFASGDPVRRILECAFVVLTERSIAAIDEHHAGLRARGVM